MIVRVRKRPDREHLQLAYTDPLTGSVKTKSAGTSNPKEAERAAARWESELQAVAGGDCRWEAFRMRFEDEHLSSKKKSTIRSYTSTLNIFEDHIGQVRSVESITASVCSQFAAAMRSTKMKPGTVAKHLRQLQVALNWASDMEIIDRAPKIKKPKQSKRSMRGRPLSNIEVARLAITANEMLSYDTDGRYAEAIIGIWLTGLRLSEAWHLHWSRGPVRLDMGGEFPRIIFDAEGQKNDTDEVVPLAPDAIRYLRNLDSRSGYVFGFPGQRSGRVLPHRVGQTISEIGRHSGIATGRDEFASAHDLRRSFGNRWALRVHPLVLKSIMRHSELKTTLRYYVSLDCDAIGAQLVHASVHGTRPWSPISG